MEETGTTSDNPFKVLKMVNGEDVICKIAEEYSDAFVIEHPMSVVKQNMVEHEHQIIEHTGLQRWMNFTLDKSFVVPKEKIISLGNLAPEVVLYYKHILHRVALEEQHNPKTEEEAMLRMKENVERLSKLMNRGMLDDDDDNDDEQQGNVFPANRKVLH